MDNILAIKNTSVSSPWAESESTMPQIGPSHASPNTGRDHRLSGGRCFGALATPRSAPSPLRFSRGAVIILLAPLQLLIDPTHTVWMVNQCLLLTLRCWGVCPARGCPVIVLSPLSQSCMRVPHTQPKPPDSEVLEFLPLQRSTENTACGFK